MKWKQSYILGKLAMRRRGSEMQPCGGLTGLERVFYFMSTETGNKRCLFCELFSELTIAHWSARQGLSCSATEDPKSKGSVILGLPSRPPDIV